MSIKHFKVHAENDENYAETPNPAPITLSPQVLQTTTWVVVPQRSADCADFLDLRQQTWTAGVKRRGASAAGSFDASLKADSYVALMMIGNMNATVSVGLPLIFVDN